MLGEGKLCSFGRVIVIVFVICGRKIQVSALMMHEYLNPVNYFFSTWKKKWNRGGKEIVERFMLLLLLLSLVYEMKQEERDDCEDYKLSLKQPPNT